MIAFRRRLSALHRDDRGMGLLELVISSVLSVLVLSLVGTVIVTGMKASKLNTQLTTASAQAQLAGTVITDGVRNASAISATTMSSTGQLLKARVGTLASTAASVTWSCQAWYYFGSSAGNAIYSKTSSSTIAIPTATTRTDLEQPSASKPENKGWTLLVDGVTLPSGISAPFSVSGKTLTLNFLATASASSSIRISSTASTQPQSDTTTGPTSCT